MMNFKIMTIIFFIFFSACNKADDVGKENGRCYGNNTCNDGLICKDGVCVEAQNDEEKENNGNTDDIENADDASEKGDNGNDEEICDMSWKTIQWGTSYYDSGINVVYDQDGNIYVTGSEWMLSKRNKAGDEIWTNYYETDLMNVKYISVDKDKNVYLTGGTGESLDDNLSLGKSDVFIIKYDSQGNRLWSKLFGTEESDYGESLTIDSEKNIYVVGTFGINNGSVNEEAFLAKLNKDGEIKWKRIWGSDKIDNGEAVVVDSKGNIYTLNIQELNLYEMEDASWNLIKWTSDGNQSENKVINKPSEEAGTFYVRDLTIDLDDNIYLTGSTSLNLVEEDESENYFGAKEYAFLIKYNSDLKLQLTRKWGTLSHTTGTSLITDKLGNIYITGDTNGHLDGSLYYGEKDVFINKFDNKGDKKWTKQWGTLLDETSVSIAIDNLYGNICVVGNTQGLFGDKEGKYGSKGAFLAITNSNYCENDDNEGSENNENAPLPGEMISISEGTFWMGAQKPYGYDDERPYHIVSISPYKIDKYEVTVGEYEKCIESGACNNTDSEKPHYNSNYEFSYCNVGLENRKEHPMNCVSWYGALAYCKWLGKRLPTEAQWEMAARGNDGRVYPWGNESVSCSYAVVNDPEEGGEGCGNNGTMPIGSKNSGKSFYGVYDMVGNVKEWVNDWYSENYYGQLSPYSKNPAGPENGKYRIMRGASWNKEDTGFYVYNRGFQHPDKMYSYYGFRCAK